MKEGDLYLICKTIIETMEEYPDNKFEELVLQEGVIREVKGND